MQSVALEHGFSFRLASRLKLNLNKSKNFGVGVSQSDVETMTIWMGYKARLIHFEHLVLPAKEKMKRQGIWSIVVEKFAKRLSSWKSKMLSLGGRLT